MIGWLDEIQIKSVMELFEEFKKMKQRDARRTLFNRSRHLLTEEGNNLQ